MDSLNLALLGRTIFDPTPEHAPKHVGDTLSCASCHLDPGKKPFAAPMRGAYARHQKFQKKAGRVVSFRQRIRECFIFSEHGVVPPINGRTISALNAYARYLTCRHGTPYGYYRFFVPTSYVAAGSGYARPLKATVGSITAGRPEFISHCAEFSECDLIPEKRGRLWRRSCGMLRPENARFSSAVPATEA